MEETPKKAASWIDSLSHRVRQALFALMTYVVLLVVCFLAVSPEQYDLHVGDVAPKTITAGKDTVDEITTERRRQAAADAVSPVYFKDETVSEQVMADMEKIFSELRAVRELGTQIRSTWENDGQSYSEADYTQASGLLSDLSLSSYQLRTLMNTSERDFEALYQSLKSATNTTLVSTITEGQISDAINNIQQIVAYNTRTDLWYNVAIPTLRLCLRPNMLIDQTATEENRLKAYEAVEPTVYKQDQNIVVKGDRVSAEQIAVMESLGLLRGDSVDLSMYAASALTLALILAAVYLFVYLFVPQLFHAGKSALVLLIVGLLTITMSLLVGRYMSVSAMPVMLAAMLAVNLLGARPAFVLNFAVSLLITFLTVTGYGLETSQMLSVLLTTSIGGLLSIHMMSKNPVRIFVFVTGLVVGVLDFAILAAVGVLTSSDLSNTLAVSGYAILGAIAAAIMCVGLQPILEAAFNLVTPSKLIELSNPNQPLLRRLMIETPGTYHHSMIVANLGEAAAEAIGADALLVRVGAYYHDIGKLIRPLYFKENQIGENPHDKTDPRVSTAILTEHTRDGVELAKKHHLPEAIIDMIRQHHGDTPVMYFYAKTVKQLGEANVDVNDFRYEGPKPQTAEAAILMLSDTVEAAVRSIQEPTQAKISAMIRKLVRGKMEDGQLDECTLTFRDIGKICTAYENTLKGVYHQRIEYPSVDLNRARRQSQKRQDQKQQEQALQAEKTEEKAPEEKA
ncbi:MAG: HDIG domain-containing protein [Clostridia bacterium]|nr:HDIG domain-containing protein [Clostridia bacterium]MBQ6859837.1 HDIG domain-containing protein [Clostridia bacterium]MBQ7053314.1 HDIG domain-containing protein [Clostridia bacterium]